MEPFAQHRGVAAPLLRDNVDTDAIIPSREMKRVSKDGLGEGLFAGWRYHEVGGRQPQADFVLNQPQYAGASLLLSGDNFGCGSSREHAVWALKEFGIRTIIAPGFGTIFANNCIRNGLLPLVLAAPSVSAIADWVVLDPQQHQVQVDLPAQVVHAADERYHFTLEPSAKRMLVEGLDAIALTLQSWPEIEQFHVGRKAKYPWL